MKAKKDLSRLELEVLRHLAASGSSSVRNVSESFSEYARTTVLTVLERLRAKGYATRRKVEGVFHYSSSVSQADLLHSVVGRFVDRALGGSVSPLVAYLSESQDLTPEEVASLRKMIDSMEKGS